MSALASVSLAFLLGGGLACSWTAETNSETMSRGAAARKLQLGVLGWRGRCSAVETGFPPDHRVFLMGDSGDRYWRREVVHCHRALLAEPCGDLYPRLVLLALNQCKLEPARIGELGLPDQLPVLNSSD